MRFSLLIAHYNNYDFFLDCYQSILNQTYDNFEVVIVDDCSTDGSFEKVSDLVKNDSRFRVFRNEKNEGVGFTKGKLIELAKGEICGFVDPDDVLTPDAIEISIASYSEKTVATYSQFWVCDSSLKIIRKFRDSYQIKNGDPLFLNIFFTANHFFTFRRDIYLKTSKISPHYRIAEDQELYLKLYEFGDFKFIKKPLLFYRLHSKGLSRDQNKTVQRYAAWNRVLEETLRRRNITKIYGKNVEEIDNLATFIYQKQNSFFKKLQRKLR
ncbi:glycosyltransferase family 2 protein [Chryseobacterium sp. SC28]|uniref:glycosyltransferase family 2 protein n=1 Tax=Chryseobacterium sp. SC28 TaxID=2268028 RepID=UPI000F653FB5|nr:glycosyltransferase [Chryseobacterium sp. SC28]RRQ47181.1 glycosyltransferase [Chryseobacterium sp. SC28]